MKHIYLSPHLDDAVLSCGGLIYNQRSKGEAVAVATLCSGFPDYNHLPPLARQWHAKCGNFENLMAERRAEDRCVLDGLGVEIQHWSTLEGIYRYIGGEIAYPDQSSLFSFVQPSEMTSLSEIWQMELDKLIPDPSAVTLYAPLAIGNHVDHQLARSLAADLNPDSWHVRFYEDVPYVEKPGAL
jgi:LmbE family N-acetylglucosaminyl deacetylase